MIKLPKKISKPCVFDSVPALIFSVISPPILHKKKVAFLPLNSFISGSEIIACGKKPVNDITIVQHEK